MSAYHLAEVNIARFRKPTDDPVNADFMNGLDRVNAIAEGSLGFIWRLVGDGNNATDIRPFDDPNMAVNLSVWADLDSLMAFAFRNQAHVEFFRRRDEWFEKPETGLALWWVPAGHTPTVEEAKAKLAHLAEHGPTQEAFTFKQRFAAPQ